MIKGTTCGVFMKLSALLFLLLFFDAKSREIRFVEEAAEFTLYIDNAISSDSSYEIAQRGYRNIDRRAIREFLPYSFRFEENSFYLSYPIFLLSQLEYSFDWEQRGHIIKPVKNVQGEIKVRELSTRYSIMTKLEMPYARNYAWTDFSHRIQIPYDTIYDYAIDMYYDQQEYTSVIDVSNNYPNTFLSRGLNCVTSTNDTVRLDHDISTAVNIISKDSLNSLSPVWLIDSTIVVTATKIYVSTNTFNVSNSYNNQTIANVIVSFTNQTECDTIPLNYCKDLRNWKAVESITQIECKPYIGERSTNLYSDENVVLDLLTLDINPAFHHKPISKVSIEIIPLPTQINESFTVWGGLRVHAISLK